MLGCHLAPSLRRAGSLQHNDHRHVEGTSSGRSLIGRRKDNASQRIVKNLRPGGVGGRNNLKNITRTLFLSRKIVFDDFCRRLVFDVLFFPLKDYIRNL